MTTSSEGTCCQGGVSNFSHGTHTHVLGCRQLKRYREDSHDLSLGARMTRTNLCLPVAQQEAQSAVENLRCEYVACFSDFPSTCPEIKILRGKHGEHF